MAAGLLAGIGLILVMAWLAARRPLNLADRIGPFVGARGSAFAAADRTASLATVLGWLRSSSMSDADTNARDLGLRLVRSGSSASVSQYRLERIVWCALGASAGSLAGAALASGGTSPVGIVLLGVVGAVAGWSARDAALGRTVRTRQRSIEAHLPALADLLALAVASGASPAAALENAAGTMSGPLADEVADTVDDIRSGLPVDAAMRGLASRCGLPAVQRFVDGILIAVERGTPLADVMRAQADDVRVDQRRRLMELAGRKDVAMLVPIVFLVLPSVVLVAVFPGIQALHLVVP
jgi:tight adherence protein C